MWWQIVTTVHALGYVPVHLFEAKEERRAEKPGIQSVTPEFGGSKALTGRIVYFRL